MAVSPCRYRQIVTYTVKITHKRNLQLLNPKACRNDQVALAKEKLQKHLLGTKLRIKSPTKKNSQILSPGPFIPNMHKRHGSKIGEHFLASLQKGQQSHHTSFSWQREEAFFFSDFSLPVSTADFVQALSYLFSLGEQQLYN